MTGTSSVPAVEFTLTGLVVPDEADILTGVQEDYDASFGGNLNPAFNTPQGQLETSTTAIIANANATFAEFVNQVDPDTASGFMQDAIARIYFLTRLPGVPTSVECLCVGVFGTVIPAGASVEDTSGNLYLCQQGGTIPIGGSITLEFACSVDGPTPCPANTVTTIYQAIPGWESVNNPSDGVAGSNVESQAAFEYRRQNSVAINASGSLAAIYAALFNVPDVIDVYVTQNFTGSTVNTGATNYPIIAHSLYAAVTGGDPQAIANAIWANVNVGCDFNGNTTETVVDTSGYNIPYPSYSISFEIPTPTPIYFAIQIQSSALLPANIVALTQAAVIAQFLGTNGALRARIGAQILAGVYYGPISQIGPEVSVLSVLIGFTSSPASTNLLMGIDQEPTITAGNISVALI
jgi:hypothetical protein